MTLQTRGDGAVGHRAEGATTALSPVAPHFLVGVTGKDGWLAYPFTERCNSCGQQIYFTHAQGRRNDEIRRELQHEPPVLCPRCADAVNETGRVPS